MAMFSHSLSFSIYDHLSPRCKRWYLRFKRWYLRNEVSAAGGLKRSDGGPIAEAGDGQKRSFKINSFPIWLDCGPMSGLDASNLNAEVRSAKGLGVLGR
jgi:hypothetical protein